MSIEADLLAHIRTATSADVYQNRAHDGQERPYVVQRLISKVDNVLGTTQARFQLDVFADTYDSAKTVAEEIEPAARSFDGAFVVYRSNELETFEQETGLHRVIIDMMMYFEERPLFD